ncbi:hypothetical protein [Psychroserpens algicola]|uniref:DUF695 domain-containing protein n=1 Tax=Psychroserpens algicola TaxID=1719034 RepID=A0ABT0H3U1_9FLAO|nr:hypothetical protein [Psychroserpens algicola]MCK8479040.1 hypothetical protein [Psychroserpens algicola]
MKDDNFLDFFDSKEKAIHHAIWLNFKYRIAKIKFGVINGPENNWAVLEEATSMELEMPFLDILHEDYSEISYDVIRHIKMDNNPLPHLESIIGIFSTVDGELLRFMVQTKFPLEKLVRHELAGRGYDEDHRWCGFEKGEEIWLK